MRDYLNTRKSILRVSGIISWEGEVDFIKIEEL